MKRLTIKGRVTLWYTLFMAALTVVALCLVLVAGKRQISVSIQSRMERALSENLEELEVEHGKVEIDDDLKIFEDGIFFVLYDEQGNQIYGQLPHGLSEPQTPDFQNGVMQETATGTGRWAFLDVYQPVSQDSGIWMRGILSRSESESSLSVVVRFSVLLLPLFVALVAVGGYYIIRRALAPIEEIRKTAEEIANSRDLSRRIRLGQGKDEVYQLADTFDGMLDRIEEAFQREKQFTSDASHELRTPTSVIVTQAEYALRRDQPAGELKDRLQIILGQAKKMSAMISQLLMLARADQGREKLQKERVDLSEMLETIAEEERERARSRGIQIHTDCRPGLYLEGDETMLMRCFMNLTENAITYGNTDGNIWICLTGREGALRGYIRDDGIGISPEHLPKIWERFYQVDPLRSSSNGGSSGLGLSMVKWIIEAHAGKISVESQYQKGTTFYFSFGAAE